MSIRRFREYSPIHPHLIRPGSGLKSEIPAFTTLADRPVVISCDMLSRNTINQGN